MKVKETGGPTAPRKIKKVLKNTSGDGSFADSLKEVGHSSEEGGMPQIASVAGIDGILAVQSSDAAADSRRHLQRLMAYGDDLLDRFEDLRLGILLGHFSKDKLTELAQRLRQKREQSSDPVLSEILAEIELRAEVEIAKYARRN